MERDDKKKSRNERFDEEYEDKRRKVMSDDIKDLRKGALNEISYDALTGLHTYCEALIQINKEFKERLKRDEGVKSGAEVDEIKKIIRDAENCQYFIERLYKEDLEMKGVEVRWNERYLWCGEEEWTEMVEAWKHYLFIRSYGTDRKDWD